MFSNPLFFGGLERGRRGGRGGTGIAPVTCMHAMFFAVKAANLRSMSFQRRVARGLGITPARFDLLWAVKGSGGKQDALARCLAVSRSNVGRMVRALERLGWVTRRRDVDRRKRVISLTERATELLEGEGRLRVKWAHKALRRLSWSVRAPFTALDRMIDLENELAGIQLVWAAGRAVVPPIYDYGHPDE